MLSRRQFLERSTLLALAPAVPAFLAQTARAARPGRDGRALVVIQLDGGNDGINTVVPFADEGYARHRKLLRLPANDLRKIDRGVGLHPALGDFARLLERGQLAVVQGVGYPNPDRSHARSMAIWQTARLDPVGHRDAGWLGRALDAAPRPYTGAPASFFLGMESVPRALQGPRQLPAALADLEDYAAPPGAAVRTAVAGPGATDDLTAFVRRNLLDGYLTADWLKDVAGAAVPGPPYPATALAVRLQQVARLIKFGVGARVFYTLQGGYDTHADQLSRHPGLLSELAGAVRAFLDDLTAARLADRVVVLLFSEFGRRVAENGSGTDHGTAGPVFLAGGALRPGLVGPAPSLLDLDDGDLKVGLDFRRVYATVLDDWLGLPAEGVLGARFERLPLFATSGG
jgi:uncharacterized protein (DUF1501 family)